MKKYVAVFLCITVMLSMSACSSGQDVTSTTPGQVTTSPEQVTTTPAQEPTAATSTPSMDEVDSIRTYPLNVKQEYADYATTLPSIIYHTTGEENGLSGSIYTFEGTVKEIMKYSDDTNTFNYESAIVMTQDGAVMVTNIHKTIYEETLKELGEKSTQIVYPEGSSNYILPLEGEQARFIAIYHGYSKTMEMPAFYLGASRDLYQMIGEYDPVAKIGGENEPDPTTPETTDQSSAKTDPTVVDTQATSPSTTTPPATTPPATTPPASNPPEDTPTAGEKNALREAQNYLRVMPFSHDDLIEQLEYEGYTHEEATYAADHCGANWREQALKKAKSYLDNMAFSYKDLIEQLEYSGFTTEESTYGADNCGADWFEQAKKSAEQYLSVMAFSRQELIDQLEYAGFTHDQAVYGVEANGL